MATTMTFSAGHVATAHSIFAFAAFIAAFILACRYNYYDIVKNEFHKYPEEWFPSISATVGDHYPARNVFQFFIGLTSGPRFALVFLSYYSHYNPTSPSALSLVNLVIGVLRSLAAGVWVYVTSTDAHAVHDIGMIAYLVLSLFYMISLAHLSYRRQTIAKRPSAWKSRVLMILGFLCLVPFLVYWFIQHKVHAVAGAYSIYALFEWCIVLFDVGFDAIAGYELSSWNIMFVENTPSEPRVAEKLAAAATTGKEKAAAAANAAGPTIVIEKGAGLLAHMADTYLAFTFWTLLLSLPLTIWYFPLWDMGLSGYESFLATTLSPIILSIPPIRRLAARNPAFFHLISLTGLGAHRVEDPKIRLAMVGVGIGASFVAWVSTLADPFGPKFVKSKEKTIPVRTWTRVVPFSLGLVAVNVVRVFHHSNHPLFPILKTTLNDFGLLCAFLATVVVGFRPTTVEQPTYTVKAPVRTGSAVFAGLAIGATIWNAHSMLTDQGILCRWTLRGYPDPGPDPVKHGWLVVVAMCAGIALSKQAALSRSTVWWMAGTAGYFAAYYVPKVYGFAGGLVFAVHTMSIIPTLFQTLPYLHLGVTISVATMTYDLLALGSVWTVAYAFVPLGEYLRERTHILIGIAQLFVLLGLWSSSKTLGSVHLFETRSTAAAKRVKEMRTRAYGVANVTLGLLIALLGVGTALRLQGRDAWEGKAVEGGKETPVTMGIWTIHFGLDNGMWASHEGIGEAIRDLDLDVVGLLESDTYRIIMGNRDLTQYLSETLQMYADYGPRPTTHTWGCALLSRFPILNSTHHLLPSPVGELACAIHATIDVRGTPVDVVVAHNGQEEDWEDRRLQTTALTDILAGNEGRPSVFLGYVVTHPGVENELYKMFVETARMKDTDPYEEDRWCQYIFYRGLKRIGFTRVSRGHLTDTEIQAGKFIVGEEKAGSDMWWNDPARMDIAERDWVKVQQKRGAEWTFPDCFRGEGVRGHEYHAGGERYYWVD